MGSYALYLNLGNPEICDNVQYTVAAGVGVTRVEVTSDGKYLVALTDTVSPAV